MALHIFAARFRQFRHGRDLLWTGPEIRVDRDRRDERVVRHIVGEKLDGLPHDPRNEAGTVNDAIPATAFERAEISIAVAPQLLNLGPPPGFVRPRLNTVTRWPIFSADSTR